MLIHWVSALLAVSLAQAQVTRTYNLDVAVHNVSPDGFERPAITLDGITPGPLIFGFKGDDFEVNIHNLINNPEFRQSLTVHWHGIYQHFTAFDDGPAGVTQCPIAPGNSYPYHVNTATLDGRGQAGTFWYHSHLSSQYIDGLRGPLIIYDPDDPHDHLYDVDDEDTVISLTDWYHEPAKKLGEDWIHGLKPEPIPDSNLFNGVGRYIGGPQTPYPVITVKKGKRYRFRIINMSAIVPFLFGVEGHSLTVIEADAVSHFPYVVSSLEISAGQRYSVVLNANKPVDNYWIAYPSNFRVVTIPNGNPNYNGTEAFAILHYIGAPHKEPKTPQIKPDTSNQLKEHLLVPIESIPPPTDTPLVVNLTFTTPNPGAADENGAASIWLVNGIQYKSPDVPTLLKILTGSGGNNQTGSLPDDVIVLPLNRTIDVVLNGDAHHPFHLHGHDFQVIQSAEGPRNEINPPFRDTVVTNDADGTTTDKPVTIRFRTDNPGPWFLHCHKDWHLEAGLAVVFAEDPEAQRKTIFPTQRWQELCQIYNNLPDDLK